MLSKHNNMIQAYLENCMHYVLRDYIIKRPQTFQKSALPKKDPKIGVSTLQKVHIYPCKWIFSHFYHTKKQTILTPSEPNRDFDTKVAMSEIWKRWCDRNPWGNPSLQCQLHQVWIPKNHQLLDFSPPLRFACERCMVPRFLPHILPYMVWFGFSMVICIFMGPKTNP